MTWIVLAGVEMVWVVGVWLFLTQPSGPAGELKNETPKDASPRWWQSAFAWCYFLYHLPLLLLDYLTTGWWEAILVGRGRWLLVEAALLGLITVTLYGIGLSWFVT
jgi:hypothetical protein